MLRGRPRPFSGRQVGARFRHDAVVCALALGHTLCGSKLWNYPDGAPKHSHACSKEERGGSLRARSGAPDYTYKPDSEAEPRSRVGACFHVPDASLCERACFQST